MENETICMPFVQYSNKKKEDEGSMTSAENSVFSTFNARRNAGRIERFFHFMKMQRYKTLSLVFSAIIMVAVFVIFITSTKNAYIRYFQSLSDSSMEFVFERLYPNITLPFFESVFYANFLGNSVSIFNLSTDSSLMIQYITSMLKESSKHSLGLIAFWNMILPNQSIIGIEHDYNEHEKIRLIHVPISYTNNVRYWETNSDWDNVSYPDSGFDSISDLDFSIFGLLNKETTPLNLSWTPLYFGQLTKSVIPMVSVINMHFPQNSSHKNVIQLSIHLDKIQNHINDQNYTQYSRIAITTSSGSLIGVSGKESPIDQYNNLILTKEIKQLNDPVWKCISSHSSFELGYNFSTQCVIDSITQTFIVYRKNVSTHLFANWNIYMVLCTDEYFGTIKDEYSSSYVYTIIIVFIIWMVLLGLRIVVKGVTFSYKSRLLNNEEENKNHHIKQIGLNVAVHDLSKVLKSHADNPHILSDVNEIIEKIFILDEFETVNPDLYITSIQNIAVRNKIMDFFPKKRDTTSNMEGIVFENTEQLNLNDKTIISEMFSPIMKDRSLLTKRIVQYLQIKNYLFVQAPFESLITAKIESLLSEELTFLCDSLTLIHALYELRFYRIISDNQILSLSISILLYHLSMRNRREKDMIIERYLLVKNEIIYLIKDDIMGSLHSIILPDIEHKEFNSMLMNIESLMKISQVSNHHTILNKLDFNIAYERTQYCPDSKTDLLHYLYIIAMVSYYFNSPDMVHLVHDHCKPQSDDHISDFLTCFNKEYVFPIISLLKTIVGSTLVQQIIDRK